MDLKRKVLLFSLVLLAAGLACGGLSVPVPSAAGIETVVAATLSALTVPAPLPEAFTPIPPAVEPAGLLPQALYFLNADAGGVIQVYRLERDGKALTQVTFEPVSVEYYAVSPADGVIAYVSDNRMYTMNHDSSGRSMIVDGGARDTNAPYLTDISNLAWSPDGQTIAFGYKGLNFYSIVGGTYTTAVPDHLNDLGGGLVIPEALYRPEAYSADGSKLILSVGHSEGANTQIFVPAAGALVSLSGGDGGLICCGMARWSPDSTAFYSGYSGFGMFQPGLWRVDGATGAVTTLVNGEAGDGTMNFADSPYLGPDNQLYYFFANLPLSGDFVDHPPMQLVRSAPDGVTGRAPVNPGNFENLNEALWAPDASFVVALLGPSRDVYQGGAAVLVFTDGRPDPIRLLDSARSLQWGP